MKNKLTIMLSAALGVVAIIAIAAPIGVAVTNSPKINNLESQLNQIREKTIGGLKPTQTLIDLVNNSKENEENQTAALVRLNTADKFTLFTVVNQNGNELANAITNDPIPNITEFSRSSDGMNWEFLVQVNWDLSQDYIIPPSFYNNGVPLVWGPAAKEIKAKDNFNEIINELDFSSVKYISVHSQVKEILTTQTGKTKLAEALVNSDKIEITNIELGDNTSIPLGLFIKMEYSWKDPTQASLDFFTSSYTYDDFYITTSIGELKDGHIPAIQEIDGVAGVTNTAELEEVLNEITSKEIIYRQIELNPSFITSAGIQGFIVPLHLQIKVTGEPGGYTIDINTDDKTWFIISGLVISDFNEKG